MIYLKVLALFIINIGGVCVCLAEDIPSSSLKDLVIQENIKGTALNKDGQVQFQAKKALFDKSQNVIQMKEDVEIKTEDGFHLKTDSIKWDQDKDEVSTDERVNIIKDESLEIQGKGLEAQPSLKKARIDEEVEVKIPQEDNSFIMITCKGPLDIDYQEGKAVFYGDVKADQKDSQIFSDKATVYFDIETRTVLKMIAEGNVRIIRGKNTSFSDRAIYNATTKKIRLEGNPRLVIFPENSSDVFQ